MKGPSLRISKETLQELTKTIDTVRCPRKGPLGAEISLVICGQLHDTRPENCEAYSCKKALIFEENIKVLRLMPKHKQLSYKELRKRLEKGESLGTPEELDESDDLAEEEE